PYHTRQRIYPTNLYPAPQPPPAPNPFPTRRSSDLLANGISARGIATEVASMGNPPKVSTESLKSLWQRLASLPDPTAKPIAVARSEEHTSELQSRGHLVCRLLLEKKKHGTAGCYRH